MKNRISTEQFAADLWEAMRSEAREQLAEAITDEEFDSQVAPWEKLPAQAREDKVTIAREELLKIVDRAGYRISRKVAVHESD